MKKDCLHFFLFWKFVLFKSCIILFFHFQITVCHKGLAMKFEVTCLFVIWFYLLDQKPEFVNQSGDESKTYIYIYPSDIDKSKLNHTPEYQVLPEYQYLLIHRLDLTHFLYIITIISSGCSDWSQPNFTMITLQWTRLKSIIFLDLLNIQKFRVWLVVWFVR